MQTILGAGGTIASVLAQELPAYTDRIRLVSRNPKKVNDTDELFPADLGDPAQVEKAIAGSEVVYLLVGFDYNIKVWRDKWPKLMRATIAACQKHRAKLVFFDNVYSYDPTYLAHMTEETPMKAVSKKGKVRQEIAQMLLDAVQEGSLTALIARAPDFYGPHNQKSMMIETIAKNLAKGKAANWLGRTDQKHTYIFTPDAAKATALLGNTPDAFNQVWHLPTDPNGLTAKELTAIFAKEMGKPEKLAALPTWLVGLLGWFVPFLGELHEMMYQFDNPYFFDSSKFQQRFGVKPTPIAQGIRQTVAAGF